MRILSLYDGMSCGYLAFQKAGIPIDRYVAYEIDRYAVQTSQHNFPVIEQEGDVFDADFNQYEGFDAVIGGSPCTYWSIAQKNNREVEASGMGWELFCQYVRAIREAKPKWFIYENNKSMSRQIRASIDEAFGFEAICINSARVSAQNRNRLYWVGARNADGTYSKVPVEQPEDLGILLGDVLDSAVECQDTLIKHRHAMYAEPVNATKDGKAQCLRATYYKDGIRNMVGNTVDRRTCVAVPVENVRRLIAQGGGPGAKTGRYAIPADKPVYEVKDGMIAIKGKQYPIKLVDGFYIIRKLTVTECMRLQTVPEWYEWPVSETQAYKMLGNGWTVDVIVHLLNTIKENGNA